jgi:putative peptide zinc metalloprotease protein
MARRTFSDSWFRVAGLRIGLRTGIRARRQRFRGDDWYILHDPYNNEFFRLRPAAFQFLSALTTEKTVEELWVEMVDTNPTDAPGQEEVVQLLSQLYQARLLHVDREPDIDGIFDRYQQHRRMERRSTLLSLFFLRVPLWDPDPFLRRIQPATRHLFTPWALLVLGLLLLLAGKAVFDNIDQLLTQSAGLLSPGNLPWLLVITVLLKGWHELGHGIVCRHFGGEVRTFGIMLMMFMPVPYMDATSSWAFRAHWQRALVGAAGMLAELPVAAVAALVWAYTGEGTLNALAFNAMIIASISTLIFNGNPLLRYDAYYILSDLVQVPNLYDRANRQWTYWIERHLFGVRDGIDPADSRGEAVLLGLYGFLSTIYRLVIAVAVVIYAADRSLWLGLGVGLLSGIGLIGIPLARLPGYLLSGPSLARQRHRAIMAVLGLVGFLAAFIFLLPLPYSVEARGVVESDHYQRLYTPEGGWLREILASNGQWVEQGTLLMRLENPELLFEQRELKAEVTETEAILASAHSRLMADVAPLRSRLDSLKEKLADLDKRIAALEVRAEQAGIWAAPGLEKRRGSLLPRGGQLGIIVDPALYRFVAVIPQTDAASLFEGTVDAREVRLNGIAGWSLATEKTTVIPVEQRELPSAVLGWKGGGDIQVSEQEGHGDIAREAFFQVMVRLQPTQAPGLFHGRSGRLRLQLAPRTVASRVGQAVEQLMQKRYRL